MVFYKYKTWLSHYHFIKNTKQAELKLALTTLILLIALYIFFVKISATINSGFETQKRTREIAEEVQKLEDENKNLKSQRDLYQSQSEIEAEYRALENKKKEGEDIYIVSFPDKDKVKDSSKNSTASNTKPDISTPNWEKWVKLIFN